MTRTHAVRIHRNGGPEVLSFDEVEIGPPSRGEVQVAQSAIGLNYIDVHHRTGRYRSPALPIVPGLEGAGTVVAIGAEVTGFREGDRVAYLTHGPGAYVDVRNVDASRVVSLPEGIAEEVAAAMMLKGLTAQSLLRGVHPVRPGEIVLIHAAAGGVGSIMCQWARALGARVIGTVSTDGKAGIAASMGCDHPIVSTREDVVARVMELTGGDGVPVVYDSVGADTFDTSLACLATRGTLVSFGTSSGPIPPFDVFRLNRNHHLGQGGSLYLTSASVFDYTRRAAEYRSRTADLFDAVQAGRLRIPLNARYALRDAAQAHRDLEARKTTGSTILVP